jgi:hypothetical protein
VNFSYNTRLSLASKGFRGSRLLFQSAPVQNPTIITIQVLLVPLLKKKKKALKKKDIATNLLSG